MHTPYCFHCETREVEAPFTYADGSGFCSAECEDAANNVESHYSYEEEDGEPQGSYDLSDDGDALASAGFGTDEDYGYFGGEDY